MPLFGELRRRNIFKVSLAYVVAAWLIVQLLGQISSERFIQILTMILILGFPVLVLLSWAYELTPDGFKPTSDVDRTRSITAQTGRRLNYIVLVLLITAAFVIGLRSIGQL